MELKLSNLGISLPLELCLNTSSPHIHQNSSRALQNPWLWADAVVNVGMLVFEMGTEAFLLTDLG